MALGDQLHSSKGGFLVDRSRDWLMQAERQSEEAIRYASEIVTFVRAEMA